MMDDDHHHHVVVITVTKKMEHLAFYIYLRNLQQNGLHKNSTKCETVVGENVIKLCRKLVLY